MENRMIRILAVDDNSDNLVTLKALIKDAFSEAVVLTSPSGKKGLELAAAEDPDVILLDIIMPGMDGFEVCKRLKADKKLRDIPVVFITAIKYDKENRIKALECGAEAFLSKPIDASELEAQIRAMLKIRAANIQKRDDKQLLAALVEEKTRELKDSNIKTQQLLEAVKKEQSLIEAIFDSIPGYLYVYDESGRLIKWNKQHETMTGFTSEELSSMTLEKWFDQEDITRVNAAVHDVFEKGYGVVEAQLILKNGDKMMTRSSGVPLILEGRTYFAGIGIDVTERIEAEKALKASEEKYRLITENASDVISVYNLSKNRFTYISPSIFAMRGLTVEEALSQNFEEAISPDSIEFAKATMSKNMEDFLNNPNTKNVYIDELQQPCKNGDLIWTEISTKFQYNSEGELETINISRNIDERKNVERRLIQSEEKFKMLFDKAPLGYQSLDIDGRFIDVNQQWLNMLGYDRGEVIGKWFGDFLSPPYQNGFRKRFPLFKAQGYIHSEFEMLHKNGGKLFIAFDGKIGYSEDGEFRQTHCILKDITIQQQLESDLKQNEERYKFLFEHSGLAVGFYKTDGTVISYNQKAAENMGGQAEEYTGKSIFDLFPKEAADFYMGRIMQASTKDSSEEYIDFVPLETGSKWFGSTFKRITNHKGEVIGVQIISQDITEKVEAEKSLRASEEKYRLLTENTYDVISVYNPKQNRFTYVSPSIKQLRGLSFEEAMNEKLEDAVTPESLKIIWDALSNDMNDFLTNPNTLNHYISEFQQLCKNGDIIWVEKSSKFQYNSDGEIETINIVRNIDTRKKAELEMLRLSFHDQLTNLYNRRFYEEELKRLDIERNLPITLIMADVNGLKLTNDAFGHQAGDILLKTIAQILKKECRADEIISRIGGDEFVILMPKSDAIEARILIDRLNAAMLKERETHPTLSLSIGYAVKGKTTQSMDEIFKEAEDDMYRHKLADSLSMRSKTIDLIMNSLFEKSSRERQHSDRVSRICGFIASNMNFTQEDIQQIEIAGLVHDIGKIGISDSILNKAGALDAYEWGEMKKHSEIGYRILSSVNEFSEISDYVLSHQERWDGKGYPQSLKGEEIPIEARIIAVADAFDAMTGERTYRTLLSEAEAAAEIRKYAGTQFDPEIARIFIEKVMEMTW